VDYPTDQSRLPPRLHHVIMKPYQCWDGLTWVDYHLNNGLVDIAEGLSLGSGCWLIYYIYSQSSWHNGVIDWQREPVDKYWCTLICLLNRGQFSLLVCVSVPIVLSTLFWSTLYTPFLIWGGEVIPHPVGVSHLKTLYKLAMHLCYFKVKSNATKM